MDNENQAVLPKTFKDWLMDYRGENNCFGQLATMMAYTTGSPARETLSAYYAFFTNKSASKEMLETLSLAWKFYENPKLAKSAALISFRCWTEQNRSRNNGEFAALADYICVETFVGVPSKFNYYYKRMMDAPDTVLKYFKTIETAIATLRKAWSYYDPRTVVIGGVDYNIGDGLVVNLPRRVWNEGWRSDITNVPIMINDVFPWGAELVTKGEVFNASYRVCRAIKVITPNNNNEWEDVKKYSVATGIC